MTELAPASDGIAPGRSADRLVTPQFLLITATTLVYFIYVGVLVPLVPGLIEDGFGGTKFEIGLAMAAFSVVAIAARPLLSVLGERYGMRLVIVSGALVALVATLACTRADRLAVLLPLRCVQGVGEAFVFVGGATLASLSAAPSRRAEAASYYSVAVFVGIGVGPLLSDPYVNRQDFDRAFYIGAGFVAAAAVLGAFSPGGRPAKAHREADKHALVEQPGSDGAQGSPAAARSYRGVHPDARVPGLVLAIGIGSFSSFTAFMPAHAKDVGFGGAAAAFALYSLICLLFRVLGAKLPERVGLVRTVSASMVAMALGMAVFAAWPSRLGVVVGTVVVSLGVSMMYPSLAGLATRRASDAEQVRVMSGFTMFFETGVVSGALAFGVVANLTGRRGAFAASAICAAVGWVLLRTRLGARLHER